MGSWLIYKRILCGSLTLCGFHDDSTQIPNSFPMLSKFPVYTENTSENEVNKKENS